VRSPVVVMICLFVLGATFWCTPTREAATLLGCRALTAGGYLGSDCIFFSSSCSFSISDFLVKAFYSQTEFLFFVNQFQFLSTETNGHTVRPRQHLTNDLVYCFLVSPMRPSAHFVARGRGKPSSQASAGAGLRIGSYFLLRC
jgi:hypothetical protein